MKLLFDMAKILFASTKAPMQFRKLLHERLAKERSHLNDRLKYLEEQKQQTESKIKCLEQEKGRLQAELNQTEKVKESFKSQVEKLAQENVDLSSQLYEKNIISRFFTGHDTRSVYPLKQRWKTKFSWLWSETKLDWQKILPKTPRWFLYAAAAYGVNEYFKERSERLEELKQYEIYAEKLWQDCNVLLGQSDLFKITDELWIYPEPSYSAIHEKIEKDTNQILNDYESLAQKVDKISIDFPFSEKIYLSSSFLQKRTFLVIELAEQIIFLKMVQKLNQAILLQKDGKYPDAIVEYNSIINEFKHNYTNILAQSLAFDYRQSFKDFNSARVMFFYKVANDFLNHKLNIKNNVKSTSVPVYNLLAQTHRLNNEPEKSLETFNIILGDFQNPNQVNAPLDANNPIVLKNRAALLCSFYERDNQLTQYLNQAGIDLQTANRKKPNQPRILDMYAYYFKLKAQEEKNHDEKTRLCKQSYGFFTQALRLDPQNYIIWYKRGILRRYMWSIGIAKLEEALNDFEEAIHINSNHLLSILLKARTLAELCRFTEAERALTEAEILSAGDKEKQDWVNEIRNNINNMRNCSWKIPKTNIFLWCTKSGWFEERKRKNWSSTGQKPIDDRTEDKTQNLVI